MIRCYLRVGFLFIACVGVDQEPTPKVLWSRWYDARFTRERSRVRVPLELLFVASRGSCILHAVHLVERLERGDDVRECVYKTFWCVAMLITFVCSVLPHKDGSLHTINAGENVNKQGVAVR